MIPSSGKPALAAKARLRFDKTTGGYLLLYPERGLALNPTAASILKLCNGELTVDGIVERLQGEYSDRPGAELRQDVIEFIEENLDGHLSLDAMAAEVEISPLYLARAFKAAIGQSPHQYVLGRRIERAKELLRNTDMPTMDVALAVGFSSQSHLSHWMLRHIGVSPAAYRRAASQ